MATSMIHKYRQQMAQSTEDGYRMGTPYRSKREARVVLAMIVAMSLAIGALGAWLGSALAIVIACLGVAAFLSVCWVAWVVWGRDKFPLRDDQHQLV